MTAAGPPRRAVLSALALTGVPFLAACEGSGSPAPSVPAELRLRARVADEVRDLATLYAAVADQFPDLRGRIGTLAAEHDAHVEALLGPPAARRLLRSARSTSPTPAPAATPDVPASTDLARAALAAAETDASHRRAREASDAPPGTARLLASIGACNAVHAMLLRATR